MNNNFNFLRFIFAFVVVLRHIIDLSQNTKLLPLIPFLNSYLCVTGFFTISGFLIWKSYKQTASLRQYFIKRAKRLLPAYIFFVIVAVIVLSLFSELSFSNYFSNYSLYKYLLCNLLFLNFLHPCLPGLFDNNWQCAVNGALWTIKVEVVFYLLIPILYSIIHKMDKKFITMLLIYFASVFYKTYFEHLEGSIYGILSRQTPGFLSYFVSGISFFYYSNFYNKYKLILLILGIITFVGEKLIGIEIFTPFAYSMIIFFLTYSIPSLNNFGKHGDYSYGIYIFHFPIIQLFVQFGYFNRYNPFIVSMAIISLVLLVAVISWNYIEKPFLKARSRLA